MRSLVHSIILIEQALFWGIRIEILKPYYSTTHVTNQKSKDQSHDNTLNPLYYYAGILKRRGDQDHANLLITPTLVL